MDDVTGVQDMRLAGRKMPLGSLAAIPAWLRERLSHDHPTFLDVPKDWRVFATAQ